jgi:single-stranded-DNA-specific exonuclease
MNVTIVVINKNFENILETSALEFLENMAKYVEVLSIHHTDADGISSGAIIKNLMRILNLPFRQQTNNLDVSWGEYLDQLKPTLKEPSAIIFSDCGPSAALILDLLEVKPQIDIYILDHHNFQHAPGRTLPESVYNCNPTECGLDGLKEIAGVTLNYLFAKSVSEKMRSFAWLAAIGMGGDTLEHFNNYKSYNRIVIEEAVELEQLVIKKGLCAYGGMFERVDKGLALSILPYVQQVRGDPAIAKRILESLNIEPLKKIIDLSEEEAQIIADELNPELFGEYITFPKKKGLFQFAFEHAQVISNIGHVRPDLAFRTLGHPRVSKEAKKHYIDNIQKIVKNLTTFVNLPKEEGQYSIIVNTENEIPSDIWSDISSFSSINKIFDSNKILLLGGVDGDTMKLSARCNQDFISKYGFGVNKIIKAIVSKLGGSGGGHSLAGGLRFYPSKYSQLIQQITETIASLIEEK